MPVMSKAERISRQRMIRFLYEEMLESDDLSIALRDKVPREWHTLEHDLDVVEPQIKITLRLDESVARFYRAMGSGYQARISRILALWAHMKIGQALDMEQAIFAQMKQWNDRDDVLQAEGKPPISFGTGIEPDNGQT